MAAHARYETTGLHPENPAQPTMFDVEPFRTAWSKEEGNARVAANWANVMQKHATERAQSQFHDRRGA